MKTIIINPPYQDNNIELLESFIRKHYKDFLGGVDTNYIKNINIEGISYRSICNRIGIYCYKIKAKKEGKNTTIYQLKPETLQGIRETKANEPIKYVHEPRFNKPKPVDTKKIVRKELKYFFLHDYQTLPLSGWGLKEYYNYYNEHHTNKASYEMFIKYFPPLDFLVLS